MEEEDYLLDSSWRAWHDAVAHHSAGGRATPDRGAYLPSPAEIELRKEMIRNLRAWGFGNHLSSSIMLHDMPTFAKVARLVELYGPDEAARRCWAFTADTEYGNSDDEYPGTTI